MNPAVLITALFGIFNLVGGVIGFVKAKSKASLIAGTLAGAALLASAYGMERGIRSAALVSLGIAFLLGARFLGTWHKNHRLMPDLLMIFFSVATLAAVICFQLRL